MLALSAVLLVILAMPPALTAQAAFRATISLAIHVSPAIATAKRAMEPLASLATSVTIYLLEAVQLAREPFTVA
jgi:hypothetical protein